MFLQLNYYILILTIEQTIISNNNLSLSNSNLIYSGGSTSDYAYLTFKL